jgi:polyisoprenoid-binding protein YceI
MSESTAGAWVLDPAGSSAEFLGKSFWGALPVRGKFGPISGSGTVGEDGTISGQIVIDVTALSSSNKQRDKHLRSADFFNSEQHPNITVTVSSAKLDGSSLACAGTVSAAGATAEVAFTAQVESASDDAVVLSAALPMSRGKLGMTWQQPGMPGMVKDATQGSVKARFVRP